jgi:ankyrin repeat protein
MDIFEAVKKGDIAYVKQSLDAKEAAVNAKQPGTEKTLLMLAAEHGQMPMVHLLLREGAQVGYADLEGNNVLINAKNLKPKNSELVAKIQQAINEDLVNVLKSSDVNNDEKIKWLSYWREDDLAFNYKVVLSAIQAQLPEKDIMEFIEHANIVADDAVAELFRNAVASRYSLKCRIAIIKLLLKNGMDLNSPIILSGYNKNTPLDLVMRSHIATKTSLELSKFLLNSGANPNVSAYDNKLPLMIYCGDLDKIKLLLDAGADPLLVTERSIWLDGRNSYIECNSLDYVSNRMKYYGSGYQPSVKLMAQAAALKLYEDNGPIALAVAKGQLEHIKMLTDISGLRLQDRSDADCHDLEESINKALEVDEFLKKYESNDPQITKCLTELQTALRERLSEKEAPKGFLSWLTGKGYKSLSADTDAYVNEPRRTLEEAKQNPRNKS